MSDYSGSAESITQKFALLVSSRNLRPGTKKYRQARERFIVEEFDNYFGKDSDLANWQRLCATLDIQGPHQSITQCRRALNKVWVNIWDFLTAVRLGTKVKKWKSEWALAEYTRRTEKYFPKKRAKDCGPVRALLAHIS